MLVEQGRGLLGKLRAQRDVLLRQAPHQLGIDHLGELDRAAGFQGFADQPRLGLGVGLLRARGGELAVDVAELLVRQHGVVVADEQVGLGAILLDLGFGIGEPHAHAIDLAGEPCAGRAGLVLLGGLLQHQVALGHRVGDLRGKLGILRLEFDRDDARLLDLERGQPVEIGLEHPLLGRHLHWIPDEAGETQQRAQQARTGQHRIELRTFAELELLDHLAREIARQNELDLAGHRLLVDRRAAIDRLFSVRPEKNVLAGLDQHPRFRPVARRDHVDRGKSQRRRQAAAAGLPLIATRVGASPKSSGPTPASWLHPTTRRRSPRRSARRWTIQQRQPTPRSVCKPGSAPTSPPM
jgi:hypothetical protein